MKERGGILCALRVALAALLCAPFITAAGAQGRPTLIPIDSIVLRESDSAFVGMVGGFAVSSAGEYFIADRRAHCRRPG